MDIIDQTQEREEKNLAAAIAHAARAALSATATGQCLNCGKKLAQRPENGLPWRWCDPDCRDDWQRREGRA